MIYRVFCYAFLICAGLLPFTAACQNAPSPDQRRLLEMVNRERAQAGLPKLEWNPLLAESALAHARLVVRNEVLSHQFPGEADLTRRIGVTGLRFTAAAENLAFAPTVERAHAGLMKSQHHRENIMNGDYNAIGIAIVRSSEELYFVQNFAHVIPSYSEAQFRDGVVAAFHKLRRAEHNRPLDVQIDRRLREAACSGDPVPQDLIRRVPGATGLVAFTSSSPDKLPDSMKRTASDPRLQRMSIGVCFKPGEEHGFARFWVVAAFFGEAGN